MINFVSASPSPAGTRTRGVVVDLVATARDDQTTFRARLTINAARTLRNELATAIAILEERIAAAGGD